MIAMCVVMPFMYNKNLKIALVHCEICAVINIGFGKINKIL